jgi:hypothetical protein
MNLGKPLREEPLEIPEHEQVPVEPEREPVKT